MKERSARRNKVKDFLTVSDGKAAADGRNDKKKPPPCPMRNSSHDLDECKNFNKIEEEWRSKFYLNRSYVMGAVKRYHNHILLTIV